MSELYQLPAGWEWLEFSKVFNTIASKPYQVQKSEYLEDGLLPIIDQGKEFIIGYTNLMNKKFSNDSNCIVFGDHTRQIKYVDFDFVVGADGTKILKEKNDKRYDLKFLYFHLLSAKIESLGYSRHFKVIKQMHFAVPPVEEQKRIVQKLDALFERIDKAIALLQKNIDAADNFMNSVLNDVFSNLEQDYEPVELTKYVNFIGGSQPPKSEFSDKELDGYIRLIQIRDYKSDNNIVYVKKTSVRRFCSKDDVMIGRYGPPVFQILRGLDGAYNVALMKAEPNEEFICKDFLLLFLKNPSIQNYIIGLSQRSAGQSGVNKEALEKYLIALPPIGKQKEIVLYLNYVSVQIEQVKSAQQQKMQSLLDLKSSILDKAFHGQL